MTLKRCIKYPCIYRSLWLAVVVLPACASTPEAPQGSGPKEAVISERHNSRFEWAIQYYEAGQYERALGELRKIAAEGPEVARYELVDFYLGMSFFHLGRPEDAAVKLAAFLKRAPKAFESQEARMTLLRCYELQKDWPKLAALAAESDSETLYFENRALLKLLWAEALQGLGEFRGADRVLQEANTLLNNLPPDYNGGLEGYDLRRELRGRYRAAFLASKARECAQNMPPSQKKASLLVQWAEGYGECLVQASRDYFYHSRDLSIRWMNRSQDSLLEAWGEWLGEVKSKTKNASLAVTRQVNDKVNRSFARLFQLLRDERKSFQNQQDKDQLLKKLGQDLESLLSRKSVPSSSSN